MTIANLAEPPHLRISADTITEENRRARPGVTLVQLHNDLWRVTRPGGAVLGYVEGVAEPRGRRYRVKRLLPAQRRFLLLGEFWSFDDALDCLHFGT